MSDRRRAARAVERYYDATTRLFLGADATRSATMHRRVFAPGVRSAKGAAEHVHGVLVEALRPAVRPGDAVLDLGCGVGATSFFVAEALGASTTGITISSVQHRLAERAAERRGLARHCRFVHGDFMHLGVALAGAAPPDGVRVAQARPTPPNPQSRGGADDGGRPCLAR